MIVDFLAPEPLTLAEVKAQCRLDGGADDDYLSDIVIPAARALAEARAGCAIRQARYRDAAPDLAQHPLAIGGVLEVESVQVASADVPYTTHLDARRTVVVAPGSAGRSGVVTYRAGIDIQQHPGVRAWMLLVCGWMFAQRELFTATAIHVPPPHIADALLATINVPAAF